MDLVAPYEGTANFLRTAREAGHTLFIVSHKTRHPIRGPQYDMHSAARGFLESNKLVGPGGVDASNIFFELTKEEKVARAKTLGVDVFIDDLPEILSMRGFPEGVRAILFDPSSTIRTAAASSVTRLGPR